MLNLDSTHLTTSGLHYVIGHLRSQNEDAVERALASLARYVADNPDYAPEYVRPFFIDALRVDHVAAARAQYDDMPEWNETNSALGESLLDNEPPF